MDGRSLSASIEETRSCAVQLVNDAPPTLKVPAVAGPAPGAFSDSAARGGEGGAMQRVLIVDDEPVVRRLIGIYLRGRFIVEEAEDGEKALRKAAGGGYDYVITDVQMPRMDGLHLLGELKRICPRTSVIVMSALGELYAESAMERGAQTVISKPFVRDTIQTALQCA